MIFGKDGWMKVGECLFCTRLISSTLPFSFAVAFDLNLYGFAVWSARIQEDAIRDHVRHEHPKIWPLVKRLATDTKAMALR